MVNYVVKNRIAPVRRRKPRPTSGSVRMVTLFSLKVKSFFLYPPDKNCAAKTKKYGSDALLKQTYLLTNETGKPIMKKKG